VHRAALDRIQLVWGKIWCVPLVGTSFTIWVSWGEGSVSAAHTLYHLLIKRIYLHCPQIPSWHCAGPTW